MNHFSVRGLLEVIFYSILIPALLKTRINYLQNDQTLLIVDYCDKI